MPPEATPAAHQTQTPPAETPPQQEKPFNVADAYPKPQLLTVDGDPNHALSVMIAKKRASKTEAKEQKPADKAEEPKKDDGKAEEKPKLNALIAKALKFTEKPAEKKVEEPKKEEPKQEKVEEPPKKEEKTTVTAKKKEQEPLDTAKLVQDVAKSTATAVADALKPQTPATPAKVDVKSGPEDSLKADDLREFQIAKHLASINPKYKGAEQVVLDHIRKSDEYASRWEAANPGKVFDPDDDEHDSFFSALEKPWTDGDFRDAEIDLKAEQKLAAKEGATNKKLKEIETNAAKMELTPVVNQVFNGAAGALAKAMGDDVNNIIMKDGFKKLEETDPLTAEVLATTLGPLHPIIETIIQLDDPKGRFDIDPNNPLHQKWHEILVEGENRCIGMKDEKGRTFATRVAYSKMSPAQRASHWYLTSDHLVHGVVEFAANTAKEIIQNEKNRIEKLAKSMGWSNNPASSVPETKTDTTKTSEKEAEEIAAKAALKPQSPSAGGGAPVDGTGSQIKGARAKTIENFASVLFKRG